MTNGDTTIRDAGAPSTLEGTALAAAFRYWVGATGRRYLTRVMEFEQAADFPGAPVVLAAVEADGRREAVWVGISGEPGFDAAVHAARAVGAGEAHVHLLAEGAAERRAAVMDMQAAVFGGWRAARGPVPRIVPSALSARRDAA